MPIKNEVKIGITTGDQDGIGPEVTAKALYAVGPQRGQHLFFWRSPQFPKKYLALIDKKFKRKIYNSWSDALKAGVSSHKEIADIVQTSAPPFWIETSAEAATYGHLQSIVTAPLSKTLIQASGLRDVGHTDILSRVSKSPNLFMTFLGEHFNVLLATGHTPLDQVSERLTADKLHLALLAAHSLSRFVSPKKSRPIALVGLNPHAGEDGLIGSAEKTIFEPLLKKMNVQKKYVAGPLVPDAAFLKQNWAQYSFYVCPYHDQGLIPFKMVHQKKSGCHLTLGLPFIRTSVDHGTAKDIAGTNKADASSMVSALEWAGRLAQNNFKPNAFTKGDSFA